MEIHRGHWSRQTKVQVNVSIALARMSDCLPHLPSFENIICPAAALAAAATAATFARANAMGISAKVQQQSGCQVAEDDPMRDRKLYVLDSLGCDVDADGNVSKCKDPATTYLGASCMDGETDKPAVRSAKSTEAKPTDEATASPSENSEYTLTLSIKDKLGSNYNDLQVILPSGAVVSLGTLRNYLNDGFASKGLDENCDIIDETKAKVVVGCTANPSYVVEGDNGVIRDMVVKNVPTEVPIIDDETVKNMFGVVAGGLILSAIALLLSARRNVSSTTEGDAVTTSDIPPGIRLGPDNHEGSSRASRELASSQTPDQDSSPKNKPNITTNSKSQAAFEELVRKLSAESKVNAAELAANIKVFNNYINMIFSDDPKKFTSLNDLPLNPGKPGYAPMLRSAHRVLSQNLRDISASEDEIKTLNALYNSLQKIDLQNRENKIPVEIKKTGNTPKAKRRPW